MLIYKVDSKKTYCVKVVKNATMPIRHLHGRLCTNYSHCCVLCFALWRVGRCTRSCTFALLSSPGRGHDPGPGSSPVPSDDNDRAADRSARSTAHDTPGKRPKPHPTWPVLGTPLITGLMPDARRALSPLQHAPLTRARAAAERPQYFGVDTST